MDAGRRAGGEGTMVGKYLLWRVVGTSSVSSEVWLATDTTSDEPVALKITEKEWIWKNDTSKLVRREIDIMRGLDHPCVVKLLDVFNSETHVFIAMDTMAGRDLHEELRRQGRLDETQARVVFQQLMMAVEYLHSIGVAHRDVRLENVVLSEDGKRIKVKDFGLAARLDEWEGGPKQNKRKSRRSERRQQAACGNPAYAAPEVITSSDDHRYDARGVDTWSAGVCLFALVTGNMPFRAGSVGSTLDAVRMKEPKFPPHLSPQLADLLRGMLRKDPSKRLKVPAVLSHPWSARMPRSSAPQPVIEPAAPAQLADAARRAVLEGRLAASGAQRVAAAELMLGTNAAKGPAEVNNTAAATPGFTAISWATQGGERGNRLDGPSDPSPGSLPNREKAARTTRSSCKRSGGAPLPTRLGAGRTPIRKRSASLLRHEGAKTAGSRQGLIGRTWSADGSDVGYVSVWGDGGVPDRNHGARELGDDSVGEAHTRRQGLRRSLLTTTQIKPMVNPFFATQRADREQVAGTALFAVGPARAPRSESLKLFQASSSRQSTHDDAGGWGEPTRPTTIGKSFLSSYFASKNSSTPPAPSALLSPPSIRRSVSYDMAVTPVSAKVQRALGAYEEKVAQQQQQPAVEVHEELHAGRSTGGAAQPPGAVKLGAGRTSIPPLSTAPAMTTSQAEDYHGRPSYGDFPTSRARENKTKAALASSASTVYIGAAAERAEALPGQREGSFRSTERAMALSLPQSAGSLRQALLTEQSMPQGPAVREDIAAAPAMATPDEPVPDAATGEPGPDVAYFPTAASAAVTAVGAAALYSDVENSAKTRVLPTSRRVVQPVMETSATEALGTSNPSGVRQPRSARRVLSKEALAPRLDARIPADTHGSPTETLSGDQLSARSNVPVGKAKIFRRSASEVSDAASSHEDPVPVAEGIETLTVSERLARAVPSPSRLDNEDAGTLVAGHSGDTSIAGPHGKDAVSSVKTWGKSPPRTGPSTPLPSYDEILSMAYDSEEDESALGWEEVGGKRDEEGFGGGEQMVGQDRRRRESGGRQEQQDAGDEQASPGPYGGYGSNEKLEAETAAAAAAAPAGSTASLDDASTSTAATATAQPAHVHHERFVAGTKEREGGESSARALSRSRRNEALVWMPVRPSGGDFVRNGLSSSPRAAVQDKPTKFQPSTFKEMATGVKDSPRAGAPAEEAWSDDDAASQFYQAVEEPGATTPATVRKLAEAQRIWGPPEAAASTQDYVGRLRATGRYRRVGGQCQPRVDRQQQGPGAGGRGGHRSAQQQRQSKPGRGPAGQQVGQPAPACEIAAEAGSTTSTTAPRAEGETEDVLVGAGKTPRPRGTGIIGKISRVFGRKTK